MKGNRMKKTAAVLAASMVMACASPAYAFPFGWGKKAESTAEKTEYAFIYQETEIKVDGEAAPVLKALGTPVKTFEQDSCAYQGKDKIYTYPGFELGVYPLGGVDRISSVYIIDDTVSTPEGIKCGSTVEDVIKAYGKGYEEQFGVYRYVLGNSELSIYTRNKVVEAIEYQIAPVK